MRSKKIRMVVTGSFLSVLAVVLAVRTEPAAPPRHLDLTGTPSAPRSPAADGSLASSPAALSSPASAQGVLWRYTNKPASAARVESLMVTPSHEAHYAQIDKTLLSSDQSPLKKKGAHVQLTLPDGSVVPVLIQKARMVGADRYVSEGTVEGQTEGRAVFAYNHGEMSAVIDDGAHGSWQMRSVDSSTVQVIKTDGTMVPACEASIQKTAAAKAANSAKATTKAPAAGAARVAAGDDYDNNNGGWGWGNASTGSDDNNNGGWGWGNSGSGGDGSGSTGGGGTPQPVSGNSWGSTDIRILVPYSKVIETVMSTDAIQTYIDLAVAELNNDFSRSAVPVTVTLAGAPALQYDQEWNDEGGPVLTALTRLTSATDGIMDQVHVMRSDANADLVCFAMCRMDPSNSGVGYILNAPGDVFNATYGFSVVNFWYMSSNSTFSHEIGHNLGCNHDRENAYAMDGSSAGGVYNYSYGYRFYGNDGQQYRTIMAYAPGNVLPYFSSPNIYAWSPINQPVGAQLGQWDEAYNALTITQNAAEVAAYRSSRLTDRTARRLRGW